VSEPFLTLALVIALFLTSELVTAFFLICLLPTLFLGSDSAA